MAGKRQHTLPRFLQKGFASNVSPDDVKVWCYRKGQSGKEVSTINVGVENYFYGSALDSNLDDQITILEGNEYVPLVNELRAYEGSIAVFHSKIPELIAHLTLRTRALRESIRGSALAVVEVDRALLSREDTFQKIWKRLVQSALKKPEIQLRLQSAVTRTGLSIEHVEEVLAQQMSLQCEDPARVMYIEKLREVASIFQSISSKTVKSAHNDTLVIGIEKRTNAYANFNWHVIITDELLILGDTACISEVRGDRSFIPVAHPGGDIQKIYLPLDSHRILLGTPSKWPPEINASRINKAIARCSLEYFISSQELPSDSHLVEHLGEWSGLFSRRELDDAMNAIGENLQTQLSKSLAAYTGDGASQ